jgi:hypothetical protein
VQDRKCPLGRFDRLLWRRDDTVMDKLATHGPVTAVADPVAGISSSVLAESPMART